MRDIVSMATEAEVIILHNEDIDLQADELAKLKRVEKIQEYSGISMAYYFGFMACYKAIKDGAITV